MQQNQIRPQLKSGCLALLQDIPGSRNAKKPGFIGLSARSTLRSWILAELSGRGRWWAVYPPNLPRKILLLVQLKFINYCDGPGGGPFRGWLSADVLGQSYRPSGIPNPASERLLRPHKNSFSIVSRSTDTSWQTYLKWFAKVSCSVNADCASSSASLPLTCPWAWERRC